MRAVLVIQEEEASDRRRSGMRAGHAGKSTGLELRESLPAVKTGYGLQG